MTICVAFIDKDNSPMYIKAAEGYCRDSEAELKLHYQIHSSLDIIEEKLSLSSATVNRSTDFRDLYLGSLLTSDDAKLYGYATNAKVKIIVMMELGNSLKDNEIRAIFKRLQSAFCDVVSNPYYVPRGPIVSKKFDKIIDEVLTLGR